MRQAGRALPEYRKVRTGLPMLKACATPDLITEITLQPVRRYQVDAAILFSDIVVPLRAIGVGIDIKPGVGPVRRQADPVRRGPAPAPAAAGRRTSRTSPRRCAASSPSWVRRR